MIEEERFMPQQTIALLTLAVVGGSGIILILAALIIRKRTRKKAVNCSAVTDGKVIRYDFPGKERMTPVLAFEIQGETYLCRKQFRGYKITRMPLPQKAEAWEDEKGYIHIKRGPLADLKELAQQLWPLGSQMQIHYDPQNPKSNYAGDPDANSFLVVLFSVAGTGLLVLSALLYGLISQAG